ncbi:MAG: hypothetical protein H7Y17_10335 [Chlorobia bacterium]|nr:hypothetical protein [Fimbriimonadaceae bacterium]
MKDDKKKFIVIGALATVLLGVGAFTFLGGSTPPPAPVETAKAEDGKGDGTKVAKVDENGNPIVGEEKDPPKNPLYVMDLPQRDPFQVRPLAGDEFKPPTPTQQLPPTTRPANHRTGTRRSSGGNDYGTSPYQPLTGSLPNAGGGSVTLTPSGPDPSAFGYTVSGTMTGGDRPVAVFTDSNGNQRMVPVGGSLDGDSKVLSVEKGSVTIEHRGKKQRLSLGGNPK